MSVAGDTEEARRAASEALMDAKELEIINDGRR